MKRAKTILFIGNNYCSTIEDLRSTFESTNRSNYVGKEGKPLRKELLAYFKDGLLSNWLTEQGYIGNFTRSTFWFDAVWGVFGFALIISVLLIVHAIWKNTLMARERDLLRGNGKAVLS